MVQVFYFNFTSTLSLPRLQHSTGTGFEFWSEIDAVLFSSSRQNMGYCLVILAHFISELAYVSCNMFRRGSVYHQTRYLHLCCCACVVLVPVPVRVLGQYDHYVHCSVFLCYVQTAILQLFPCLACCLNFIIFSCLTLHSLIKFYILIIWFESSAVSDLNFRIRRRFPNRLDKETIWTSLPSEPVLGWCDGYFTEDRTWSVGDFIYPSLPRRRAFSMLPTLGSWVTLFKEIIPVYSENHTQPINIKCRVTWC
jgi:hypothetical protein